MGWNICLIKNEVAISAACAEALFKAQEYKNEIWWNAKGVTNGGKLSFNYDHKEHMDYLDKEHIQEVLKEHKVQGIILFCCADGEFAGYVWGYEFDGLGGMVEHRASLK